MDAGKEPYELTWYLATWRSSYTNEQDQLVEREVHVEGDTLKGSADRKNVERDEMTVDNLSNKQREGERPNDWHRAGQAKKIKNGI